MTVSNDTPSDGAPSGAAPPVAIPPPAPAAAERPPAGSERAVAPTWPAIRAAGVDLAAWLMRPRVRLTLTGVLLLLVGGLIAPNTVWTLPLVIVGALMVAVAWIGHRLEGRFAVEWGEAGTQLAFNTTIKAPHPAADAPAAELTRALDDVIEGEAHTVEINVRELKALIAAAEAAPAAEAPPAAPAAPAPPAAPATSAAADTSQAGATPESSTAREADVRDIRIRRVAEDGSPAPRPAG